MKIEISYPDGNKEIHDLPPGLTILGRSSKCNIQLDSSGVSRQHLAIHRQDPKVFVEDLGSSNGTKINEIKLTPKTKQDFTTFFPVMLGPKLAIRLLDEEVESSAAVSASEIKTNSKKRRSLNFESKVQESDRSKSGETRTTAMRRERTLSRIRRNIEGAGTSAEDKKKARLKVTVLVFVLLGGLHLFWQSRLPEVFGIREDEIAGLTAQKQNQDSRKIRKLTLEGRRKIAAENKSLIQKMEQIQQSLEKDMCLNTIERIFCNQFAQEDGGFLFKDAELILITNYRDAYREYVLKHPLETHEERILIRRLKLKEKMRLKREGKDPNTPIYAKPKILSGDQAAEIIATYLLIDSDIAAKIQDHPEIQRFTVALLGRKKPEERHPPLLSLASAEKSLIGTIDRQSYAADFRLAIQASELQAYRERVVPKIPLLWPTLPKL